MYIVTTLPQANAATAAEARNKHAYQGFNGIVVCCTSMSRIVGGKHDLTLQDLDCVS